MFMGDGTPHWEPLGGFDPDYEDQFDQEPREIECKHCQAIGLHWSKKEAGWRLVDEDGNLHLCLTNKRKAKRDIDFNGEI